MTIETLPRLAGAFFFLLISVSALAHHSDSVFNQDHLVTVAGTVTAFDFTNPHTVIHLDVKGANGNVVPWIVTGGPPNHMTRSGWKQNMFKVGEQLTISGFQYNDGRQIMLQIKIVRANGESVEMSESETNRLKNFDASGNKKSSGSN